MGRKKILDKRMTRLLAKKKVLAERAKTSEDVAELRSINEQLADVNAEIEETQEEIDSLPDETPADPATDPATDPTGDPNADPTAARSAVPVNAVPNMPVNPIASFGTVQRSAGGPTSVLDSLEYRQAFANYVRSGESAQLDALIQRADETLLTSDVGKIIPNTIMNEFLKDIKVYGQLFNKVRKLNVKGGVEFPIEDLVPTVTWITETTTSQTQKAPEIKTSISFGYHIVEARLSQSLLSQVVSLNYLESEIARLLAEAFIKEFDRVILKGSGNGQPLGILNDSRVKDANKLTFTATDMKDWTKFRTNLFAKIPLKYRGQGLFIMTAGTWEANIMTLKDANNRPIYQETYNPTTGQLECKFAGRDVILVEPDMLADFDTASSGDVWGLYIRPTDYVVNTQLQIGFKRWFDDDKNKWINKGLCIMDGKLLDVNGVYILKK